MRPNIGKWYKPGYIERLLYIDVKSSSIIKTDDDIAQLYNFVQTQINRWRVGVVMVPTEAPPFNVLRIELRLNADHFPGIPANVAEVTTTDAFYKQNEFEQFPAYIFENRLPADCHNLNGLGIICTHIFGHAAGLGHSTVPNNWMFDRLTPTVKDWDDLQIAFLDTRMKKYPV